jgi:hypothetical protein
MPNEIDYEKVLADLKERRARLDVAISAIESILGASAPNDSIASAPEPKPNPITWDGLRKDSFFRMTVPQSIKKFLAISKAPQSTVAISDAMKAGGLTSTSKNLYATIYTALIRLQKANEVVRVGEEWGLAEWYPGAKRVQKESDIPGEGQSLEG